MTRALLFGLLGLGCATPPKVPHDVRTTERGLYAITYVTRPSPVPLGGLFEIEATLTSAATGAPITDAAVSIDARMPQHGHGMPTRPEDDPGPHAGGVYVTRGMKFHMQGDWVVAFDVIGPAGPDRLEVTYRQ